MDSDRAALMAQVIPVIALSFAIEVRAAAKWHMEQQEAAREVAMPSWRLVRYFLIAWGIQCFLYRMEVEALFFEPGSGVDIWMLTGGLTGLLISIAMLIVFVVPFIVAGLMVFVGTEPARERIAESPGMLITLFLGGLMMLVASSILAEVSVNG